MAIAGHISPRMLEHYSHFRMDAKRKALEALGARGLTGGYGTNSDTKPSSAVPFSEAIEKNGGDDGNPRPLP